MRRAGPRAAIARAETSRGERTDVPLPDCTIDRDGVTMQDATTLRRAWIESRSRSRRGGAGRYCRRPAGAIRSPGWRTIGSNGRLRDVAEVAIFRSGETHVRLRHCSNGGEGNRRAAQSANLPCSELRCACRRVTG